MSRMKMALLALFAASICTCALGPVNASATPTGWQFEECLQNAPGHTATQYTNSTCTTTGSGGWYWSPIVPLGSLKDTNAGSSVQLEATVAGVATEIKCSNQSGEGEVGEGEGEAEGAGVVRVNGLKISWEECVVARPAEKGCTVPSTITTESLRAETIPGVMNVKYTPTSGTTIAKVTVTGCSSGALNGEKLLTGTATATVNEELGVEEFTATSGSALKFAGQTATFLAKHKWCTPGSGRRGRFVTA